jgi:hypothetical protein
MELTILMPCLNDALNAEACIREARAYHEEIDPLDEGQAHGLPLGSRSYSACKNSLD